MEFQRYYEKLAFKCGGENYHAPVQLVGDFINDSVSTKIGRINPSYAPGHRFADLRECLPEYVTTTIKDGLINFDKRIRGFAEKDAILTGIETRTSAPVRINRDENCESVSLKGMYPVGEGAGYAGGIMSAAVDGLKIADILIKKYKPLK
jgi:uncharacterized FAD-dependent dehydrogenase